MYQKCKKIRFRFSFLILPKDENTSDVSYFGIKKLETGSPARSFTQTSTRDLLMVHTETMGCRHKHWKADL